MSHATLMGFVLLASLVADVLVRPHPSTINKIMRSPEGMWIDLLMALALFALALALFGNPALAALITVGFLMALTFVSNTKSRVLGEPLLFTDLALLGDVFRHPRFYLTALKKSHLAALVLGFGSLLALLAREAEAGITPRLWGLGILALSLTLLVISLHLTPWRRLASRPDIRADVAAHGLVASLLLYWRRWSAMPGPAHPAACLATPKEVTLLVAVQCESFADPVELFENSALALPGLSAAREVAWRHGRLLVSGFGAYTMRTEYGVLFGRDEDELGFRRYDPYLTALGDREFALPALLGQHGWHSIFVHPHDLGFYGRDRIMPAAGFDELVGPDPFGPTMEGRYVSDAAVAELIIDRAGKACSPTFIHAVTIENHGPWPVDRDAANHGVSDTYLRLVRKGDAMLTQLTTYMSELRQPAVLLFYGDHRPSIPDAVVPGGDRHTPYVILRFGADGLPIAGPGSQRDLTPAELHRAIIEALTA